MTVTQYFSRPPKHLMHIISLTLPKKKKNQEHFCSVLNLIMPTYLGGELVEVSLLDVHDPAAVQQQPALIPPGQRGRRVRRGLGQQIHHLANQSPGRVPAWPPHNSVQGDVRCGQESRGYQSISCLEDILLPK